VEEEVGLQRRVAHAQGVAGGEKPAADVAGEEDVAHHAFNDRRAGPLSRRAVVVNYDL
jgi:hypothetical protein